MAKRVIQLSDVQAKNARPRTSDYKLSDGRGLYLLVTPEGRKILAFPVSLRSRSEGFQLWPLS